MWHYLDKMAPRQLVLIGGGTVVLLIAAAFTQLVWPGVKAYRAAAVSYAILEQAVSGGNRLEQQLSTERATIESLGRRLHGDMADLPHNQMEAYIIGQLQRISWQSHMELVSVEPYTGQEVLGFRELGFDVEVKGTYLLFFDWLRAVEQQLGFVVVKQFEIAPVKQMQGDPLLVVRLTMVSYRATSS